MIGDAEWVRNGIAILALLVSVLALLYSRRDKTSEANKSALDRIEKKFDGELAALKSVSNERHEGMGLRLGAIESRLAGIEEGMRHVPTARDIDMLQSLISNVASNVSQLKGSQDANTRMVERMNQYLMERGT